MKKFNFAMENLLSFKNQILDNELQILSELNRQHENTLIKMSKIHENYENCKANLNQKLIQSASPQECQMYMYYIVDLNEQTKAVQREIDKVSMRIVEQIHKVREMKMETKSLETLKEKKFAEYKKAVIKTNELHMDEFIAGTRYLKA
ncbi:MAG: flagellar FliJ family protein [Eubacteriales bacterium]